MLVMLSFGDLRSGTWGALWDLDAGRGRFALLGDSATGEARPADATIDGSDSGASWRVTGPGIELEASPEGEAGQLDGGFVQLTRIRGHWTAEGSERAIDCLGLRGTREEVDPERFESIRGVSAWFGPDLGMAVVAARPRGSTGHADDLLSASVIEEGHALRVEDPRLSTTYSGSGLPVRATFELWLEHPEDEAEQADEDESVARFPRRAAGEALGASGHASAGPLEAHVALLRWHARGREGTGLYVLARLGQG